MNDTEQERMIRPALTDLAGDLGLTKFFEALRAIAIRVTAPTPTHHHRG